MGQVRDDPEAAQKQEVLLREIADLQDMSAKLSKLQIQVKEMAHKAECSEHAYVTHADLQSLAVFHAKPRTASVASKAAAASVPHTVIAVKAPSGTMLELLHSTNWRNTREEKFEAVLTVKDGAGSIQPFLVQKPPVDPARVAAAAAAKEPPLAPLPAAATSAPLGAIARERNGTSERLFQVKDLWSDQTKSVRRSLRVVKLRAPRPDRVALRPRRRARTHPPPSHPNASKCGRAPRFRCRGLSELRRGCARPSARRSARRAARSVGAAAPSAVGGAVGPR